MRSNSYKNMHILYILKHNPGGIGGGCKASYLFLKAFIDVFSGSVIDVLLCEEWISDFPKDLTGKCHLHPIVPRGYITKLFSLFTGIMHRCQKQAKTIIQQGQYDYCIFDHSSIAGTLIEYTKKAGTKSIVINHNFEQDYFRDNTTSFLKRLFLLRHVCRCERSSYKNCNYNIFLTKEDMNQFFEIYGKTNSRCMPLYVFESKDLIYDAGLKSVRQRADDYVCTIIITGSLSNIQNVDAVNYFIDELYDSISHTTRIVIAGKDPSEKLIRKLSSKSNIEVIPNPKDINEVVKEGDIYLCPARLGGGIKVRITDGLRNGLPVLAHEVSARGYSDFREKGFLHSFHDKTEFEKMLDAVMHKLATDSSLKNRIQDYYQETCRYSQAVYKLKRFIMNTPQ